MPENPTSYLLELLTATTNGGHHSNVSCPQATGAYPTDGVQGSQGRSAADRAACIVDLVAGGLTNQQAEARMDAEPVTAQPWFEGAAGRLRVHPVVVTDEISSTQPHLAFAVQGDETEEAYEGPGLVARSFALTLFSKDYQQLSEVGEAVEGALRGADRVRNLQGPIDGFDLDLTAYTRTYDVEISY